MKGPPRIKYPEFERYWVYSPPERSARCAFWVERIQAGWRGNRRIHSLDYYSSAEYYGIYIWEYWNVIWPLLKTEMSVDNKTA